MSAGWTPREDGVHEIAQLLKLSQESDSRVHKQMYDRLHYYNETLPDFNCYLVYILTTQFDYGENVRSAAGLLLKRHLSMSFDEIHPDVHAYVQSQVISCISDQHNLIRATAGIIITTIVQSAGLDGWPGLLEGLYELLETDDYYLLLGTMSVLCNLSEDVSEEIHGYQMGHMLSLFIGRWLALFEHPDGKIRKSAIKCINQFIMLRSAGFLAVAEQFMEGLYALAMDEYVPIRRYVCEGMVLMLQVRSDLLMPRIGDVVDYMVMCSASDDDTVALEACDFWTNFAPMEVAPPILEPCLVNLIPVLLRNLEYSPFDIAILQHCEDDSHIPDRLTDIAPHVRQSRLAGQHGHVARHDYDDDDEEEEDLEFTDTEEVTGQWNLRKSAAAGIDVFSGVFGGALLPFLMPVVQTMMNSEAWEEREGAILALGAISEGCLDGLTPELPGVLAYLIETCLHDGFPLVRKITCWALSRYCQWVLDQQEPDVFLGPYVRALLGKILDKNKLVQESACSAMSVLIEKATTDLTEYLEEILTTFVTAMEFFHTRSLRLLYDTIGTLAENSGDELGRPELAEIILPPMMAKWEATAADDQCLFALMESLTSVVLPVGTYLLPYANSLFYRCSQLLTETLQADELGQEPDKDYLVCALDLLSSVVDATGAASAEMVVNTELLDMLLVTVADEVDDVRQSSFSVIGDIAKTSIELLYPYLPAFIPILTQCLDPSIPPVCNNAGWAVGEIIMQVGEQMRDYLPPIIERLVSIVTSTDSVKNRNLVENSSIALGRIALHCPDLVAPFLTEFVHNWCLALRGIHDDEEKASAFRGMCALIEVNPQGIVRQFMLFCDAIASWSEPPQDLSEAFSQILFGYKESVGDSWVAFYAQFPDDVRQILAHQYGLS